MFYHRRLINHFLCINTWIAQHDAQAHLDMRTFRLQLKAHGQTWLLYPQFLLETAHAIAYSRMLTPQVNGFIGWMPYMAKRWPAATHKLFFKRYMEQHGKRTPRYWLEPEENLQNVLIKPAAGSFGLGQRGPFGHIDPSVPAHHLNDDEFYEAFHHGAILKAWYWNDRPLCIELRHPPRVRGDGIQPLWALMCAHFAPGERALRHLERRRAQLNDLLALQGMQWDSVPKAMQTVQVDYLYGSPLFTDYPDNTNQLGVLRNTPLGREISACGPIFWKAIPPEIRQDTLYAVDGVICGEQALPDSDANAIRWLEMNCNPMFPPDGYAAMLDALILERHHA